MKCKYTTQDIESFLDSIFVSNEKEVFMEHLNTCPECRSQYMILSELRGILTTPVRLEKDMSSGIMKSVDRSRYKKGRGLFALKGLFFKYPSVIKAITTISAAILLTFIIAANFSDISYSLSSFKENIIDKLNTSHKINKHDNADNDSLGKAIIANNDNVNVNTQVEGTAPVIEVLDKEIANQLFYSTAIMKETVGRKGPGNDYEVVESLKYGQIVQIQGWLDNDSGRWYLAKLIPGIKDGDQIAKNINFGALSEFWIPFDVTYSQMQTTAYFDDIFYPGTVAEYRYIVRSPGEKDILLKQLPDDKSLGACLTRHGDLIAVVQKDAEWSLVKKMNASAMEEYSRAGWIKNSDYTEYALTMSSIRPSQGFLAKPFVMYSKPGTIADIPESIIKNTIVPVNVVKWEGEWVYVSSGFNGIAFYVKGSDLKFAFSEQELAKLINPDIAPDVMLEKLKSDIMNWKNIRLVALDYPEYSVDLTKEQKAALASKLTKISDIEKFDGGITPSREAPYPFYVLEFMDDSGEIKYPESVTPDERGIYDEASYCGYSFVIAGEDKLLVTLGDRSEYYGMSRYHSVPIKFIKVNKEFISYLKMITTMTVPPNIDRYNPGDRASMNYLLNAVKVNFLSPEKTSFNNLEGTLPQQVWKTVRSIIQYVDFSSVASAASQPDSKLLYEVRFTFPDGSVRKVEITDAYIRYNGYCYKYNSKLEKDSIVGPEIIIMGLFAAYF